ncbi:hypothetical protein D6D88_08630, partial [Moraxella catarrhalis]|uniref:hypothetical protein n=1 Tax=Moraxella catarrhalis TaxID=480 RepID=UPI000EBE8724
VSAFEFDADDDSAEVNALMEKKRCPKCNTAMDGYIVDGGLKLENKRLYAEKMGDIVTERLVESFPDLMDYAFTAGLEDKLDE